MAVKLIALDMDGTVLNSEGNLSLVTEKTLNEAVKQGIHVMIATGRAQLALPKQVTSIPGIEYAITSNGAAVIDLRTNEIIYENYIAAEAMKGIYNLLSQSGFVVEIFIKGKAYIEKEIYDNLEKKGIPDRNTEYIKRTRNPREDVLGLMMENKGYIENINVCFERLEDKENIKRELLKLKNVTITSSLDRNLEIVGETTSKGTALREMCRRFNINMGEVMACGDSPNDEAMLEAAGIPVAMGNAKESVKRIAMYVTDSNDEDGVANAIKNFVF